MSGLCLGDVLDQCEPLHADQTIMRALNDPIKAEGHLTVLHGSLAPDGAVGKITGKEGMVFEGPALVYDSGAGDARWTRRGEITPGVVIVMYSGPKGGPGMPEMLTPTSALVGAGLSDSCGASDGWRFSRHARLLYWSCRTRSGGRRTHLPS